MNMLSNLRALLFSSTAAGSAAAAPMSAAGGTNFAAMLDGSLGKGLPAADPSAGSDPAVETPVASETGAADMSVADAAAVDERAKPATHHAASHGLAIAVAAGKASGTPLSLPPGLALGLARRAAPAGGEGAEPGGEEAVTPAPEDPAPADPTQVADEAPFGSPTVSDEAPTVVSAAVPIETDHVAKPFRLSRRTDMVITLPHDAEGPQSDEPVSQNPEEARSDKAEEPALVDTPMPLPAVAPVMVDVAAPAARAQVSAAPPVALPADTMPRQAQSPDKAPAAPTGERPVAQAPVPLPMSVLPDAAAHDSPIKAEALALLQLVREQVSGRQSGGPARLGEAVSDLASRRGQERKAPAEALVPAASAASLAATSDVPQVALPSSVPASPLTVGGAVKPSADLSASLGAQVVDMGVSGQWIDGLARDIAGLSAEGAQGRFQINAHQLGPVQVDISQGSDGAAVHLTVASEAAELALRQDSDRLKLDAGLSAVRIAEVKIDRAPHVAEAARSDTAGQQSSQQQSSSQGSAAWSGNGQNMGQPQGQASQQGRWRGPENNGFTPKSSGDPAVLNHAEAQQDASGSRRARYA